MKTNEVDALLQVLFDASPHDFMPPEQVSPAMKRGLAQCWGIEGFREYLEHAMNKFILNSALRSETMEEVWLRKGRILTLKELLEVSKTCFHDYDRLKKLSQKDALDKVKK